MAFPRFVLAGDWRRFIGDRQVDFVRVPGSHRPIGDCRLEHTFARPWPVDKSRRVFLVTEGVLATAEFRLNGQSIGRAGPWARYRFEIPPELLQDQNTLTVHQRDTVESFGPPPGRRFDGGLIRPLWLESRPATFLEDFRFTAELDADCSRAQCTVAVEFNGPTPLPVRVVMAERDTGVIVADTQAPVVAPARFTLDRPRLWSPDRPNLYTVTVYASEEGELLRESVGVRRIEARKQDFYLNNERLMLKGVCRHEFTSRSGYSPTETEIRRELALMKHAGFNFIRLVHSPQGPEVCRIAAELGLLVSEEPGTCFHDLADPVIYGPAFECLLRTVKRDRNVPSIFAWLIYNECNPNSEYAVRAAKVCRELDPGCRLSFADCTGKNDEIRAMVQAADLTFYGVNVYGIWAADFEQRMKQLTDRPLVFTEWGGLVAQGNPRTAKTLCDAFVRHSRVYDPVRFAGCCFWAWADYEERSRPGPAAVDGWTIEGLLDAQGKPKEDLHTLSMMWFEMDHPPTPRQATVEVLAQAPRRAENWRPVDLTRVEGDQSSLERPINDRRHAQDSASLRLGRLLVDGIEFVCRDVEKPSHPLMLGGERKEAVIPVGRKIRSLAVLGHVAMAGGFPRSSVKTVWSQDEEPPRELGDLAGEYELVFEGGSQTVPLRHGFEVLRSNDICRWWLTTPRSTHTKPGVRAVIHPSYEILRVDLWELKLPEPRVLKAIRWRLSDPTAVLAMFGLSVEVTE